MPRTTNDGSNGALLRTVLSRSPLTLIASSDSEKKHSKESAGNKEPKDYRKRASSLLLHRRSNSVQTTFTPIVDTRNAEFKSRRQKSLSHIERLNPLITSRFSISPTSSYNSEQSPSSPLSTQRTADDAHGNIIQHGEVLMDGTGWRRRTEYLVLTQHNLWRFKSSKKAAETFPQLVTSDGPATTELGSELTDSASLTSTLETDSFPGLKSPMDTSGSKSCISLDQIIAIRSLDTSRARNSVEISWQSAANNQTQCMVFNEEKVNGPTHWLDSLRQCVRSYGRNKVLAVPKEHWTIMRNKIGLEADWELRHGSVVVPVVLLANESNTVNSIMSEAYQKDFSPLYYLIVGRSKVYIVPLTPLIRPMLGSLQSNIGAFCIINLSNLSLFEERDNSFNLTFRYPRQPKSSFRLASVRSSEIIQAMQDRLEELRPHWPLPAANIHPDRSCVSDTTRDERQDVFVRVLQAYCRAWGIYISSIAYEIDHDGEDAPRFTLIPRSKNQPNYTLMELLAVFRALRYNNYFVTISFAHISLDELAAAHDHIGHDHICTKPSIGSSMPFQMKDIQNRSLLFQELSAVVMTGRKLRRLNFTSCFSVRSAHQVDSAEEEQGCGIMEPLYRLCANQNTNVDWLIFNGINLRRADIDYIMAMFGNRDCHLRAIELNNCNLDMWSIRLLLNEMPTQKNTLEVINISNNPGRLSPDISIDDKFASCQSLRKVNLSRILRTNEPVSLLPIDIIASWRLEELRLSQTSLNTATVDDLIQYLRLPSSRPLQQLHLDGCGLNSEQLARLFDALTERDAYSDQNARFHLDISNNLLDNFDQIATSISLGAGLSSLTWRLVEIQEAKDFMKFMHALQENQSIKRLDLSQLYLDFCLNENDGSIAALASFFEHNDTLEELNLSANNSRLDDSQLGVSVHKALLGLSFNSSLRTLRIEDQAIGAEGAQSLAQVLRNNTTLRGLYCARNKITFASFTLLVDALQNNHTLTHLSSMESDKSRHVHSIETSMIKASRPEELQGRLGISPQEKRNLSQDVVHAIEEIGTVIDDHWTHQRQRLDQYLQRNRSFASREHGSFPRSFNHTQDQIIEETTDGAEESEDEDRLSMPSLQSATAELNLIG